MIEGNTTGLSKSILARLEAVAGQRIPRDTFFSRELCQELVGISNEINREISIYVNMRGEIVDLTVGESDQVSLPFMKERRSDERLSGIRCIHTHPGGSGRLSSVDLNSLKLLRFDAMAAVGVDEGEYKQAWVAMLNPASEDEEITIFGPLDMEDFVSEKLMVEIMERDRAIRRNSTYEVEPVGKEAAVLIGINTGQNGEMPLDELEQLVKTAGGKVVYKTVQNRHEPDPATYIGRGKAAEISLICKGLGANLAVFDDELSATQIRNLEEILGLRVIDRTSLILDIFARRAISREGKLQVELAQLKYRLPRLMGMGGDLSRLGGGIGTRGPGEKKLETDRRHIRRRIREIEEELSGVRERRQSLRNRREKSMIPVVALVGYTNSGKSTLLNAMTGSQVLAEDKLFATLDPVSRGIVLENNQEILLIDTVGFINKLPHDLVEAFKSTLEEAVYADLLVHVVDASAPGFIEQMAVVEDVLRSLGARQKVITVYNKMDAVKNRDFIPKDRHALYISALKGEGLDELGRSIARHLSKRYQRVKLFVPYSEAAVLSSVHRQGQILSEEYGEDGIYIEASLDQVNCGRFEKYRIGLSMD